MQELNIDSLGADRVETMFEEKFAEQIGKYGNIDEFEAKCERSIADDSICMNVTIIGLAGSPTLEKYLEGDVENVEEIVVGDEDYGFMTFTLCHEDCTVLNTNDYLVVYKA